jgi:hypothetical protein
MVGEDIDSRDRRADRTESAYLKFRGREPEQAGHRRRDRHRGCGREPGLVKRRLSEYSKDPPRR